MIYIFYHDGWTLSSTQHTTYIRSSALCINLYKWILCSYLLCTFDALLESMIASFEALNKQYSHQYSSFFRSLHFTFTESIHIFECFWCKWVMRPLPLIQFIRVSIRKNQSIAGMIRTLLNQTAPNTQSFNLVYEVYDSETRVCIFLLKFLCDKFSLRISQLRIHPTKYVLNSFQIHF